MIWNKNVKYLWNGVNITRFQDTDIKYIWIHEIVIDILELYEKDKNYIRYEKMKSEVYA